MAGVDHIGVRLGNAARASLLATGAMASPPSATAEPSPASILLFGSLEAGPSAFVTSGAKYAPDRIDREGFAVLASVGSGARTEGSLIRRTVVAAALVGYQWFRDWGVAAAYAGPEWSVDVLTCGCGTVMLPPRVGLRLHGEVWARPTEETLVTATLILGSARMSAWNRLSWGRRIWGTYLGPEAAVYLDGTGYRKGQFGLHATDFAVGRFRFRASAGYQITTERGGGAPYLALSLWTPL